MQASVADIKKVQEIVNEFLGKLGVSARAKVFAVEEYLKIEIEGKDSPILIGYHGDNLWAIKHLLSLAIRRQVSEEAVVLVDIADYLSRKEKKIQELAKKAATRFDKSGEPSDLPLMNAYERRIAHSYLGDLGYISESVGEGQDRHIVVKK